VNHRECEDCGKCRATPNEEWCIDCDYYSCERGPDCRDKIYKVIKNGHAWDYSNHLVDVLRWRDKILREEPDAETHIEETTQEEWDAWRIGF
jgi:hypothetical protein